MKRYTFAYILWLTGIALMAGIALEWYRRVEQIGWQEVAERLQAQGKADGAS